MRRDVSTAAWTAVLARCVQDCAAARNGHGRRWAVARAERALAAQADGALSSIDAGCVQAARRLGEWMASLPADVTPDAVCMSASSHQTAARGYTNGFKHHEPV